MMTTYRRTPFRLIVLMLWLALVLHGIAGLVLNIGLRHADAIRNTALTATLLSIRDTLWQTRSLHHVLGFCFGSLGTTNLGAHIAAVVLYAGLAVGSLVVFIRHLPRIFVHGRTPFAVDLSKAFAAALATIALLAALGLFDYYPLHRGKNAVIPMKGISWLLGAWSFWLIRFRLTAAHARRHPAVHTFDAGERAGLFLLCLGPVAALSLAVSGLRRYADATAEVLGGTALLWCAGAAIVWWMLREYRVAVIERRICPTCCYDLRGQIPNVKGKVESVTCPECGGVIDVAVRRLYD